MLCFFPCFLPDLQEALQCVISILGDAAHTDYKAAPVRGAEGGVGPLEVLQVLVGFGEEHRVNELETPPENITAWTCTLPILADQPLPLLFCPSKGQKDKGFSSEKPLSFHISLPKIQACSWLCPRQVLSGNSLLQIFRVLWAALLYIPVPLRATCKGTAIPSPFSLLPQLYTSHKAQEIDLFYFWGREVFHWCLLWPLHTARYLLFLILASLAVHSFEILLHQKAVMVICYTCLMSHKMKWQMICSAYN